MAEFFENGIGPADVSGFHERRGIGKDNVKKHKIDRHGHIGINAGVGQDLPQSDRVEHSKITLHNRYGITLAADVYKPKNARGRLAAVAVSGPYGAVKSRFPGRYAQTLAERGFLTVAFDPSFYGESGGAPATSLRPKSARKISSAAVDYLTAREDVDPGRIGILGICGWGGFALNAATNDPRIKATVTSTMYDMSRVNANGYFDAMSADDRYKLREQLNAQRSKGLRQRQL